MKYAIDTGMIDLSHIHDGYVMKKREEFLSKHPYKVWSGNNGCWYTYLPDKDKGRVLKKRKTQEDIEDIIVDYWKSEEENPTIEEVFQEWNDRRLNLEQIKDATHTRLAQTFDRFFGDMRNRKINSVSPEEIEEFLEEQIFLHKLNAKGFGNLKSLTKGMLKRARKRKLIDYSVADLFNNLDISNGLYKREPDNAVFTEDEYIKIMYYLQDHLDGMNAGIMLMFLTGIRIGELVTLKNSDFAGNTFKILRTETKYITKEGETVYAVSDFPKTEAGIRVAIIPRDYTWLAAMLKRLNPFGEYIFVTKTGKRLLSTSIRKRLYKICDKLGLERKSPHKIRRTYASILLDHSLDQKLITDLMGHTDIKCTEDYYHKNRRSIEKKFQIISDIPEFSSDKVVGGNHR